MKSVKSLALLVAAAFVMNTSIAQEKTVNVGGAPMKIMLTDEKGGMATVTISNVHQSNGVIHVIDHVVLPRS